MEKPLRILTLFILLLSSLPSVTRAHVSGDEEHRIRITSSGFIPKEVSVERGEAVTFVNEDDAEHWPASNLHPTHTVYPNSDIRKCGTKDGDSMFDSCRGLKRGESYTFTFTEIGTWRFHDHLHANLGGTIVVTESSDPTAVTLAKNEGGAKGSATRISTRVKTTFLRLFYALLPARGDQKLGTLNMFEVAKDEQKLEFWMRVFGYNRALSALESDAGDPSVNSTESLGQCHTEAHYIGRMAHKLSGISSLTEERIDTRCQFGFYHGVMDVSLGNLAEDDIVRKISEKCASYTETNPVRRIFCEHAIGHGLLVHYDYDLPRALGKCSLVTPIDARGLCYHGAYMENAFVKLGIGVGHETPWADWARPDFPCTSPALERIPGAVEHCYFSQSLIWGAPFSRFDGRAAIAGCLRVPAENRELCFTGLGFSAGSPQASLSDENLSALCASAPEGDDRRNCLVGATFMRSVIWDASVDFQKQSLLCSSLGFEREGCSAYVKKKLDWVFER